MVIVSIFKWLHCKEDKMIDINVVEPADKDEVSSDMLERRHQLLCLDRGPFVERLKEDLKALGDTVPDIASKLKSLGIKGQTKNPSYCPIAQYLKGQGWLGPRVSGLVQVKRTFCDAPIIDLPQSCKEFIRAFDCGEFPSLEN